MTEIERIIWSRISWIDDGIDRYFRLDCNPDDLAKAIEQYVKDNYVDKDYVKDNFKEWAEKTGYCIRDDVIKAREQSEGLVIKKYIMTLPMDIRRAIMAYDSERIAEGIDNE
jgi:hypothetical protein